MENKKSYIAPQIELIELDNEISLALESTPPQGPGELGFRTQENFINTPYNTELT